MRIYLYTFLTLVSFLFVNTVTAQFQYRTATSVQVELQNEINGNTGTLTVSYISNKDHVEMPHNAWASQLVTLRYPQNIEVTFSDFENLTELGFSEDTHTPEAGIRANDGYVYKKFDNDGAVYTLNLKRGEATPVFTINYTISDKNAAKSIELVTGQKWTDGNNGDVAVFNVGAGGNVFGSFSNTLADLESLVENSDLYLSLYPNPTTADNIQFILKEYVGDLQVDMYDLSGRLVFSDVITDYDNSLTKVSPSEVAEGTYYLKLTGDSDRQWVKKVIILE